MRSLFLTLWPFLSSLALEAVEPAGCKINGGQTAYVQMFAEREGGDRTNGRAEHLASRLSSEP